MSVERHGIDWDEVKRRLRDSERALEAALVLSPDRLEAAYRARATELAQRQQQTTPAGGTLRVLEFALGQERYALELADLVELLPFANVTPVPEGPPALLGVMNVHEEIRSVVDLGRLLGLPASETPTPGYVIVLSKNGRQLALRVDAVDAITTLTSEAICSAQTAVTGVNSLYLRGITQQNVQLLDTNALLAHPLFGNG